MFDLDRASRAGGPSRAARLDASQAVPDSYKWVALFISTLGMLMATIDGSITLISLPDIFRGIGINPLEPGNSFFLLWMILGFLVVTSVLVVSLGRLGDIYGRVRTYNFGFAVFTFFSVLLSVTWLTGHAGGYWLIIMRIFQGVGAAMLMSNSAAILTDAFPPERRGMAMGVNQASAMSGSFIGLVLGGVLANITTAVNGNVLYVNNTNPASIELLNTQTSGQQTPIQSVTGSYMPSPVGVALGP